MIPGQMSIFDFIQEEPLETIPEEEMVKRIGSALGVSFKKHDFFGDWRATVGQSTLTLEYDRYQTEDEHGKRFIGCGVDDRKNHCGACAPIDNIKDAIRWFEGRRRKKEPNN